MSKKIMITLPDDIHEELKRCSEESMRPLATEALYRVKLGLSKEIAVSVSDKVVGVSAEGFITDKKVGAGKEWELPSPGVGSTKSEYQEVIDKIEGSLDRDLDYDETKELKVLVESSGLKWNAYRRRLEKVEGSGYKIIHQF